MILVPVPVDTIPKVWSAILPFIEKGIKRHEDRYTVEGIAQALHDEKWGLWIAWKEDPGEIRAILATEIYTVMTGDRVSNIPFLSGEGKEDWFHLLEGIEQWAIQMGCQRIEMVARKGLARHLKDYRMTHVMLSKDLDNGTRQDNDDHTDEHTIRTGDTSPGGGGGSSAIAV